MFDITFTAGNIPDGLLTHDDGVGLYAGGILITPDSTAPHTVTDTGFDSEADLDFWVERALAFNREGAVAGKKKK